MDFIQALDIANAVFDQYKADQPKWWRKMDGTPILNDVAVRMAETFSDAAAAPQLEVPQGFIDYVQANYNGVIDIHSPEWHAKRLWRAAMFSLNAAAPDAPAAQPALPVAAQSSDLIKQLRKFAGNPGYSHGDYADIMRQAAADISRRIAHSAIDATDLDAYESLCQSKDVALAAQAERIARLEGQLAQPAPERACYLDAHGTTRCSGCQANHDLNQDHDEDCWVGAAEGGSHGWISVTDRLPEDGIEVAIVGPAFGDWTKGRYVSKAEVSGGGFYSEDGDDMHSPSHWALLPDAPAATQGAETPKDGA